MAVTYAVSNRTVDVNGSKRVVRGNLTWTGTYTSGGDALTPEALGLHTIQNLYITNFNNGSATVPISVGVHPIKQANGSWKLAVSGNVIGAVNVGTIAATPTVTLTAAETLTNYVCAFEAVGT
jgi:hypothetical protein